MNESIVTVGNKVKSVRELKSVDIETVAERTGLTTTQIEMIENGESVSLAPLIKIARALGVRLGTFLDDIESDSPVVCRSEDYDRGVRFNTSGSNTKHLDYYSLARAKSGRYMEPFIIEINNSKGDEFTFSSHEGEEFIYCMDGIVEVVYGQKSYALNPGDSIYYDSIVEHGIQAVNGKAKILAVVYAPA
ncbi:MAG: XRE family transcriptional regulator [Prevotellaceae bacterium]|jgi:transcriptional regulator with XRE-family HTH domain|nr:XRE family transcriptional regulator [Prevotellaceae bacterium]